jgi:DNA-binding NarL/FixJ family response regulator
MQGKRRRPPAPSTAPAHVAESPDAAATGVRYGVDELFPNSKPLSVREREALELLADGKSNEVIATVMGNSKRTVEDHVAKVFEKLDVDDREEAMALYHHAIEAKLEGEIAELIAQVRALEEQNAALRRQLRRRS